MGRWLTGIIGGIVAMLLAAPAQALSPPEVFLKELAASDLPMGDWVPLAGAQMHSVNGYEIGVRLQDTGAPGNRQRILVQATEVPNGRPDLQHNIYPLCFSQSGAAGQIIQIDERVRFAGDGTYSLAVTASTGPDASTNCTAGAMTTGSFTASAPTVVRFEGRMLRLDPSEHHKFGGLVVTPAVGSGGTEAVCARDPRTVADGSLTGSLVINPRLTGLPSRTDAEELFPKPGRWACVARGISGGVTPGPWSAPTPTQTVQTGFYQPRDGNTRLTDARGPVYRINLRLDPLTAGGTLTVELRRFGTKQRTRIRTRIGRGGLVSPRFKLPHLRAGELGAHYVEYLSFGGSQLVAARPPFGAVALDAVRTPSGRIDLEFTPPCPVRRC